MHTDVHNVEQHRLQQAPGCRNAEQLKMAYIVRRDTPSGGELFQTNGSSGTQKRTPSKGEFSGYGAPTGDDAEKLIKGIKVRRFAPPSNVLDALMPGLVMRHAEQTPSLQAWLQAEIRVCHASMFSASNGVHMSCADSPRLGS